MKKSVISILLLSLLLTGCGASASTSSEANSDVVVEDNRTQETEIAEGTNVVDNRTQYNESISVSDSDFEVKEYLYENTIGDTLYFLAITNNSQASVGISSNGTAKDSDGNILGADDMSVDIVGPGETTVGYFYFDSVSGIDTVEYQLSYDTKPYYYPVLSNLSVEQNLNDKNLTLIVTNNGDSSAEFVEAYAIFLDSENKVLHYDSTYVTDGDSEIKSGATISAQLDCYKGYDHVDVYLTGRSTGKSAGVSEAKVSDSDFEITPYLFENTIGNSLYFLVVKNNSSESVGISGNATAKDESGNTIGAADMSIDILGPGEQSIGYFYFDSVSGIADVQYSLSYDTEPYYDPVISNLSVEQTINNKNVVVTVTNNGTQPAKFVEAYALFLDADNNVVHYSSGYVTDDDSEIKSGATLSEQLDTYKAFDHVEVFFTGRS